MSVEIDHNVLIDIAMIGLVSCHNRRAELTAFIHVSEGRNEIEGCRRHLMLTSFMPGNDRIDLGSLAHGRTVL